MRKPFGRRQQACSFWIRFATGALLGASWACGSENGPVAAGAAEELGLSRRGLDVTGAVTSLTLPPAALAFELTLAGERLELALERTRAPTTTDYRGFRLDREGALIALPPPSLDCTYRGVVEARDAAGAEPGFAAMSVCAAATGRESGSAVSGILKASGRFWRLTPDPNDRDDSDGVDHIAQPLRRGDSTTTQEPALHTTLQRLPESPAPLLAFREGTAQETKFIDLIAVNDAARVASLGDATEATTLQFVDTMNALLETSGLSPRLRVTLRGQVLFDQDPYTPVFAGDEVDNDSLLRKFVSWGSSADLPDHDEHMLLSGLDFVSSVVGFAWLGAACSTDSNGFIVQAGDESGGFAVLSAVHELGHTLGLEHDDGSRNECPEFGFIMAATGCGDCPGAEQAEFSPCSVEQFQAFLAGPAYEGERCADDVPSGGTPSCGDGVVEEGESCDCGSNDCSDIDPCCDGSTCQLEDGADCSDFNDLCCRDCAVIPAAAAAVCRAARSSCDISEVCAGDADCPPDSFEAAGGACEDERGNAGACFLGDCRSRGTQCERVAEQQNSSEFDGVGAPHAYCELHCSLDSIDCGMADGDCLTIGRVGVIDGVPCDGGQCVGGQCVTTVDQCPNDPQKDEPGDCGCGNADVDSDRDDVADCVDGCPADADKRTAGACGCGAPETDSDDDATPDCIDECPSDAQKAEPGDCGCGNADIDSDSDGAADCIDECPTDRAQQRAGACGCGVREVDSDSDGTPDCVDGCVTDPSSTAPPCSIPGGTDTDGDGDVDVKTPARRSSKGGCALAAPGVVPRPPGTATPSLAMHPSLPPLGWLTLAAVPLVRRRLRRRRA